MPGEDAPLAGPEDGGAERSSCDIQPVVECCSPRSLRMRFMSEDGEDWNREEREPLSPKAPLPPTPRISEVLKGIFTDLWTITRLAWRLSTFVWTGSLWLFMFLRLVLFTLILLPGFAQMVAFYFFSPRVLRSVCYGAKPRNRLDVYLPRRRYRLAGPCPVLVYVTGGAWTIGYKAWGALFGRRLSQRGVLVFCIDYRNFPQGTALDMTVDINTGIKFVLDNAHLYGGDPQDCVLVGQSAGGHLTALSLLAQVQQKAAAVAAVEDGGDAAAASVLGGTPAWDPSRFKFYVAVSGAYNLLTLADYLNARGLYRRMFESMMSNAEGRPMLEELSPTAAAAALTPAAAAALPPMMLLHGSADKSVPIANAMEFSATLKAAGVHHVLKIYPGKTHTQPIVEDPMRGGRDKLMDEVLGVVRGEECCNTQLGMLPSFLIDAATAVCPF